MVCSSKDPVKRTKRKVKDGDKIFVNHMPDKKLLSKIHKELSKLNSQINNPIKNGHGYKP